MTPEEEMFSVVKSKLETNSALITAVGGTPRVHYWRQNANTDYPYIIYDLNDIRTLEPPGIGFTGRFTISLWFYASNSLKAFQTRTAVIQEFNQKTIHGTNLVNCRFWYSNDSRKEVEKKDNVRDKDVICHDIVFDVRYYVVTTVEAAEFTI